MKIVWFLLGIFIVVLGAYMGYLGFFNSVDFTIREMGPYQLVYREHRGDYSGTGVIQKEIYKALLNDEKIRTTRGFGIYYDDPRQVKKENLRSIAGCILEEKDYQNIESLKKKYSIMEFHKTRAVVTEFPFRGRGSILAGVLKVYPRLDEYTKERGYAPAPVMEIYNVPEKKIIYIMPIRAM